MKRSLALLPVLALVVLPVLDGRVARADDKNDKNVISVAISTKSKNPNSAKQVPQYLICDTLKQKGYSVQSRVPTTWDGNLKKTGIVVVAPEKKDDGAKKDDKKEEKPATPSFTIEGTIELVVHEVPFYGSSLNVICFNAKVDVVIKDSHGKELKKISFQNLHGKNQDAGEDKVVAECEQRAARFILREIFQTKEIGDLIPKEKKDEFAKFLADEDTYWKENFDDTTKHKVDEKKDEKKADDEKK